MCGTCASSKLDPSKLRARDGAAVVTLAHEMADFASELELESDCHLRSASGQAPCPGAGPVRSTSSVTRNNPGPRLTPHAPPRRRH
jgi:hypothetical protein